MNVRVIFLLQLAILSLLLGACAGSRGSADLELCRSQDGQRQAEENELRAQMASQVDRNPDGVDVLVLSGGGRNGAFGAGVLAGWRESASSSRPESFDVVTAISTGALLGTFAFLGDAEVQVGDRRVSADEAMKLAYTTTSTEMVLDPICPLWALLFGNSLNDSLPLTELMERYIPNSTIDLVGTASGIEGRKFYVGTANLDCGSFVVWDMGELAARRQYDRYRRVLLASAAVPGIFPPVEIDGFLHVDGGTREQLFLRQIIVPLCRRHARNVGIHACEPPRIHIIVNGPIGVLPEVTRNRLPDIATRSIAMLMDEAQVGNLFRVQSVAQRYGAEFRVIHVSDDIRPEGDTHDFDPVVMRELYRNGVDFGRQGRWSKEVPTASDF